MYLSKSDTNSFYSNESALLNFSYRIPSKFTAKIHHYEKEEKNINYQNGSISVPFNNEILTDLNIS